MSDINELVARIEDAETAIYRGFGVPPVKSLELFRDIRLALEESWREIAHPEDIPNTEPAPAVNPMPESASGCLYGCA